MPNAQMIKHNISKVDWFMVLTSNWVSSGTMLQVEEACDVLLDKIKQSNFPIQKASADSEYNF